MLIPFSAVILASQLVTMVADNVPKFDIERGCRLDNAASVDLTERQPIQKCVNDEQQARQQLQKQWSQFRPLDRASCTADTRSDGTPSYVELLTCLQIAKEARGQFKN